MMMRKKRSTSHELDESTEHVFKGGVFIYRLIPQSVKLLYISLDKSSFVTDYGKKITAYPVKCP